MLEKLFLLTYFVAGALCKTATTPEIIEGEIVTDRTKFAYQALVLISEAPHCGGAILDERHVLTAAHCVVWDTYHVVVPYFFTVAVGQLHLYDNANLKEVSDVIVHPAYNSDLMVNDIAIIKIVGAFLFSDKIHSIPLDASNDYTGANCMVSGWGPTGVSGSRLNTQLRFADTSIHNWEDCSYIYSSLAAQITIRDTQICAGILNKDSCQENAGGPLVCNNTLTGIASFGGGCGSEYPGVYTQISKYLDWINSEKSSAVKLTSHLIFFLLLCLILIKCL